MVEDLIPFASPLYFVFLSLLMFARGMDFLSTWVATPNLLLEANPIARKLGWKVGIGSNVVICGLFALWPLPAVTIITTSLLVAARNLQSAWLMRTLGEHQYRLWMGERLADTPRILFYFCLFGQCMIYALVGTALLYFSQMRLVPFGVGMGMVTYSVAVFFYTTLSVWRVRHR